MGKSLFSENPVYDDSIEDAVDMTNPADDNNEKQTPFNSNNNMSNNNPWGNSGGSNPFVNNNNNSGFPWNQSAQQSPFGGGSVFGNNNSGFGQQNSFGSNFGSNNNQKPLPRHKRIIITDFFDNLVNSYTGGNVIKGIWDLKPMLDVWQQIKSIDPDFVIICTNKNFASRSVQEKEFVDALTHYKNSLASFIEKDGNRVLSIYKSGWNPDDYYVKPNPGMAVRALKEIAWKAKGYSVDDILVVGNNSGYSGQSNRDIKMAENLGVDYIDVSALLKNYV